ncbi:MAG: GAF domain-containing protein, partial [Desulfobulbaceae bacterium]|nr:GAF domain-containing protein [Desulfobulbaceae bacterium]
MTHFSDHGPINSLLEKIADDIRVAGETCPSLNRRELVDTLLAKVIARVRGFAEAQWADLNEQVKIGLALSSEKEVDRLFEMIVDEARRCCNADGGTLYIKNSDNGALDFVIAQNDSLKIRMGGSGDRICWPAVPLVDGEGNENHRNVSAHCALVGEAINIADVYEAPGFDFNGTKEFDSRTGYRSRSMLVMPLRDHEEEVVGVLQLLNAKDRLSGEVGPFGAEDVARGMSLASQAAIALTKMRLLRELENLLFAFLQTIAHAIDEKSPYTSGHIVRVAEITEQLIEAVNGTEQGGLADVVFNEQELAEIRMAAWLHDVGKITTPEHIIDKATKLETIHDRIELVRYRVEILKRDAEIHRLRKALAATGGDEALPEVPDQSVLDEHLAFLEKVNVGGEFLSDASIERVKSLAGMMLTVGGREIPLLNDEEIMNLVV